MKSIYLLIVLFVSLICNAQTYCNPFLPTDTQSNFLSSFGDEVDIYENDIVCSSGYSPFLQTNSQVFIFNNQNGTITQSVRLYPNDALITDSFGKSISIYGNFLAVGSPKNDMTTTNAGAVYLYKKTGNSWDLLQKIQPNGSNMNDEFGTAVKMEGDYLFCSAVNDDMINSNSDDNNGSVTIYKRNGDNWDFHQQLTLPNTQFFGKDIQIDSVHNALYIYSKTNATTFTYNKYLFDGLNWIYTNTSPLMTESSSESYKNPSICFSNNLMYRGEISINAPLYANIIQIYDSTNNYQLVETVPIASNDFMIGELHVKNNDMFIGFSFYFLQMTRKFPVKYYKRINGVWTYQTDLKSTQIAEDDDYFGNSIDTFGDMVIIGSHREQYSLPNTGKAYWKNISTLNISSFDSNTIQLNPNPTKGELIISGITNQEIERVMIYQADGKIVKTYKSSFDKITLAELQNALYFVSIESKTGNQSIFKVIKN